MSKDYADYTPENLGTIAGWLEESIEKLRGWGVRVSNQSRLPKMARLLADVSTRGAFPTEPEELGIVAEAIQDGEEFVRICDVLPEDPIPSLISDLQEAVSGALGTGASASRRHLQYQSQLWVSAMMVMAGAPAGVLLRPKGPNPDVILPNGNLNYALEVKRPEGELDAKRIIRRASKQIRSGAFHGGSIVVDVTDCLDPAVATGMTAGAPLMTDLSKAVQGMAQMLHKEVFDDGARRIVTNREAVFSMTVFGRGRYWNEDDLSRPHLGRSVASVSYWQRSPKTLRWHRARWLTGLIHAGMKEVGFAAEGGGELDW